MELVTYTVPYAKGRVKPVVLAPLGDIQWAGKRGPTATSLLKEHIAECVEKDAIFLGLGDYTDFLSPSNRQKLNSVNLYDQATDVIDDKASDLVHELFDLYLRPTVGRWMGLLHGHHWAHLKSGETTDMLLCELLKARFLGTSAFVRLIFQYQSRDMKRPEQYHYTLWAHHGCGGGMKVASPLNKLENMVPYVDADMLVMGHTTKKPAASIDRLTPRWNVRGEPHLHHRTIFLVNSGGFAQGYQQGSRQGKIPMGLYPELGMMGPATLGAPIVTIRPDIVFSRDETGKHRHWSPKVKVEI